MGVHGWASGARRVSRLTVLASILLTVPALGLGCAGDPTPKTAPSPKTAPTPPLASDEERTFGRVVRVIDGDTLEVSIEGQSKRVRLAEIDTPERAQPWGTEATAALVALVDGREVALQIVDVDRYARLVCTVFVGEVNVNHAMLREGHAWAYTEYTSDLEVIALEDRARAEGLGLWALPEAERDAPWVWRRSRRGGPPPPPTDPRCTKRRCDEMTSCEEARFHLDHCARSRLDADRDGVPCERLCAGA